LSIIGFAVRNKATGGLIDSRSRKWSELPKEGFPRLFSKAGHAKSWIKLADLPEGVLRSDLIIVPFELIEIQS